MEGLFTIYANCYFYYFISEEKPSEPEDVGQDEKEEETPSKEEKTEDVLSDEDRKLLDAIPDECKAQLLTT